MDFDPYFHMHDIYFRRDMGPGNQDINNMMMQNPRFRPPVGTLIRTKSYDIITLVYNLYYCLCSMYVLREFLYGSSFSRRVFAI